MAEIWAGGSSWEGSGRQLWSVSSAALGSGLGSVELWRAGPGAAEGGG